MGLLNSKKSGLYAFIQPLIPPSGGVIAGGALGPQQLILANSQATLENAGIDTTHTIHPVTFNTPTYPGAVIGTTNGIGKAVSGYSKCLMVNGYPAVTNSTKKMLNTGNCPIAPMVQSTKAKSYVYVADSGGGGGFRGGSTLTPEQLAQIKADNPPWSPEKLAAFNARFQKVLPQAQVNVPLNNNSVNISVSGYIATCDLELDFQGSIKALNPITQADYQANQQRIYQGFKSDVAGFLEQIQILQGGIVKSALESSQMTLDLPSNGYTANTATISSTGITVDSSTDTGTGSAGMSLSTTSPTTLVFHFDTVPIIAQNSDAKFSGNLSLSLSVTLTPIPPSVFTKAENYVQQTASEFVQAVENNTVIVINSVGTIAAGTLFALVNLSQQEAPIIGQFM